MSPSSHQLPKDVMDACVKFCQMVVASPDIPNATARIGAWLLGVAAYRGGFPQELTLREIREGFSISESEKYPGTGSRTETIRDSLAWLEERKLLRSEQGSSVGFGHFSRRYWITL